MKGPMLTRIIHERFYCNRGYAATTSLAVESVAKNLSAAIDRTRRVKRSLVWRAGSPLGLSTYCFKYASGPRVSTRKTRPAHRLAGVHKRGAH